MGCCSSDKPARIVSIAGVIPLFIGERALWCGATDAVRLSTDRRVGDWFADSCGISRGKESWRPLGDCLSG